MLEKFDMEIIPALKVAFILLEKMGSTFPEGFPLLRMPFSQY